MVPHNGYSNWATWNVNLWIMNSESIYWEWKHYGSEFDGEWSADDAVDFVYSAFPDGTPDMDSHRPLHDVDYAQLASRWTED